MRGGQRHQRVARAVHQQYRQLRPVGQERCAQVDPAQPRARRLQPLQAGLKIRQHGGFGIVKQHLPRHGDIQRFKQGKLRWLGKKDTVVVLGDFGFVWDGSAAERKRLDWLRKRPYTILFLDGSHENYDLLAQYPETELFGGRVQSLGGNVYHVCRGSVLELEGKTYLCFGGAESQDKDDREPGVNWWKQEMPSDEEYDTCRRNLEKVDYKVDYVLTHDAPSRFLDFTALALGESNRLHLFLDEILLKLTYEKWFFGCYHKDVQLSTKSRCVFCDVIPMGERRTGLFHR